MKSGYHKAFAVCVVIVLGGIITFAFSKDNLPSLVPPAEAAEATDIASSTNVGSVPAPLTTSTPQMQSVPNGITYTSSEFDFSLTYPSTLSVTEYDEGGGTKSVVFQKPNEHVGFQMFITPDDGDDPLTPAGIKLDFPTLEMHGIESLMVGTGTAAVAFASNVPDFGPTQELWLTHDGYLFEIVTYPDRGPWLAQIINTIRFPTHEASTSQATSTPQ
jgi:hypothetical protein